LKRALVIWVHLSVLPAGGQIYVMPEKPPDARAFQQVPGPGIRFRMNEAQATEAPWIDSNAWRIRRGLQKVAYPKLPAGAAALAAAEAFTYGVEAILNPDPADRQDLDSMLRFLKEQERPRLPAMANIAILDDRSPEIGEVLNMLTRRNLLYEVVSAPSRRHDLTVRLGTKDFPRDAARNPSDFAARVRARLGDDKRLVRVFGSNTMIVHLTGDGTKARLYLLSYGRRRNQQSEEVRVRVLGRWRAPKVAAYAAPEAQLADVQTLPDATEFTVPLFRVLAIVDLEATK
jgi:hypothetical protein